jgi:hypothetical protein
MTETGQRVTLFYWSRAKVTGAAPTLVVGQPGAGKSGATHDVGCQPLEQGRDVICFAVDRLDFTNLSLVRAELGLGWGEHRRDTYLAALRDDAIVTEQAHARIAELRVDSTRGLAGRTIREARWVEAPSLAKPAHRYAWHTHILSNRPRYLALNKMSARN